MPAGGGSGGVLTTDRDLVVRSWDEWVASATRIPAEAACGRTLVELFPEVEERGLASRLRRIAQEGVTEVLAPAFHGYLIPCPPREPSAHFSRMQQHVTLAPLRAGEEIVGVIVTIEDVTGRRERERELAQRLRSSDEKVRIQAVEALAAAEIAPEILVSAFGDASWRVRGAAVEAVAGRRGEDVVEVLTRVLREQHQDLSALNATVSALAATGEDVLPPLLELLQSPDPDLRIYVALALGQRGDSRAAPGLLRALEDDDPNVRFHALEALGRLRARIAAPAIAEILGRRDFSLTFAALDALAAIGDETVTSDILPLLEEEWFRSAALAALGRLGGEEILAPLTGLLARDEFEPAEVAEALWAIHGRYERGFGDGQAIVRLVRATAPPGAGHRLMLALGSASGAERPALVGLLGWLGPPGSDDALVPALAHPEARAAAVDALVRHGPRAADALLRGVGSLESEALCAAVAALGRIGSAPAVPTLLTLLEETSDADVAVAIIGALGTIGDPSAFEPLIRLLDDTHTAVRHAAVGALSSIGHPALRARVLDLLVSPSAEVREAAARIAGYFAHEEYADRLFALCDDPDESVRRAAVEHAAFLDDPRVPAMLARELRVAPAPTRAAAARALSRLDAGNVAAALVADALADPDLWVRYYAARSAAALRIAGLGERFADLAHGDPAVPVRLASLAALAATDPARAVPALAALLDDPEPDVRAAALLALGRMSHPAAVEALATVLASGDSGAQRAALDSLERPAAAALADEVAEIATSARDAAVASAAASVLLRAATPEAVRHLCHAAERASLREQCVELLARLPEERLDVLREELRTGPEQSRGAVLAALAHMDQAGAGPLAAAALDDPSPAVRRAAALTLCRHDLRAAGRK